MTVVLNIKLRTTEKSRQEIKLFNARMRDAMAAHVQDEQWRAFWFRFDDIVKRLDQTVNAFLTANAIIK